MISFDDVREECKRQIHTLAPRLIPGGRVQGVWYTVAVPWRNDKRASLAISLTTAIYRDWGMPGDEGSMIDLVMKLDTVDAVTAKNTLAGLLGLDPAAPSRKRVVRKKPRCADCSHAWERYPGVRYCTTMTLDEEPRETRLARRPGQACGPYGEAFTPRANKS